MPLAAGGRHCVRFDLALTQVEVISGGVGVSIRVQGLAAQCGHVSSWVLNRATKKNFYLESTRRKSRIELIETFIQGLTAAFQV